MPYNIPKKAPNCPEKEELVPEWARKVQMTPPSHKFLQQGAGGSPGALLYDHLAIAEVERQMKESGMSNFIVTGEDGPPSDEQRIIYFLFGSGLASGDTIDQRKTCIETFLSGAAKTRMLAIIEKDSDRLGNESLRALWKKNQKAVILYSKKENATTIFVATKKIPYYVGRLQMSKNCYVHAAAATVGYKVACGNQDNGYKVNAVDVCKVVRHAFTDADLERRVVYDKSRNSRALLRQLIGGVFESLFVVAPVNDNKLELIVNTMAQTGPALLSRFKTDAFFSSKRNVSLPNDADGEIFIHEFDRVSGVNQFNFVSLGVPTQEDLQIVRAIENANPPSTTAEETRSLPNIAPSSSTESTESKTTRN